ncbi:MAG: O-methyltransferase [Methyloligellaceae bacterium]
MKQLYPDHIQSYINLVTDQPTPIQEKLLEFNASHPQAVMQTPHDQVVFLSMLVASLNAKKVLEIGVFTGYSALAIASALPDDGKLIACDINEKWTSEARKFWEEAGVSDKITLHIGPAIETVNALISEGQTESFDLAYIDADKKKYEEYYEASLSLLRQNGLIILDNMLWRGQVADADCEDEFARALRQLAIKISQDKRVSTCMLPTGDGAYIVRKL